MAQEKTVGFHDLAETLNVRVSLLVQLAEAGKIQTVGNRITRESADELRWQIAINRGVLSATNED